MLKIEISSTDHIAFFNKFNTLVGWTVSKLTITIKSGNTHVRVISHKKADVLQILYHSTNIFLSCLKDTDTNFLLVHENT